LILHILAIFNIKIRGSMVPWFHEIFDPA